MRGEPDPGGGDGPITTRPPQSPNASQQPPTSCRLCSINYTSFEELCVQGGGGRGFTRSPPAAPKNLKIVCKVFRRDRLTQVWINKDPNRGSSLRHVHCGPHAYPVLTPVGRIDPCTSLAPRSIDHPNSKQFARQPL